MLQARGVPVRSLDMGDLPHTAAFFANGEACTHALDAFLDLAPES